MTAHIENPFSTLPMYNVPLTNYLIPKRKYEMTFMKHKKIHHSNVHQNKQMGSPFRLAIWVRRTEVYGPKIVE